MTDTTTDLLNTADRLAPVPETRDTAFAVAGPAPDGTTPEHPTQEKP